MRVKGQV